MSAEPMDVAIDPVDIDIVDTDMKDAPMYVALPTNQVLERKYDGEDPKLECLRADPLVSVLGKQLGAGSYGTTYEACSQDQSCAYVAKVIPLPRPEDERNFRIECQLSAHASTRGFGPKVYRMVICEGSKGKHGILVMERLDATLTQKYSTLTQDSMKQLLDCIQLMHEDGLWHNDCSPDNIMCRKDGTFVVIDYGLTWPLFRPVPPLLRMADLLIWILPEYAYDPKIQKSVVRGEGVSPRLLDYFQKTWGPNAFGDDFPDIYDQAIVSRIFDKRQVAGLQQSGIRNDCGPFRSLDLFIAAVQALEDVQGVQMMGVDLYLMRAVSLRCDFRQSILQAHRKLKDMFAEKNML